MGCHMQKTCVHISPNGSADNDDNDPDWGDALPVEYQKFRFKGIGLMVPVFAALILQCITITVYLLYKDFRSVICYRIMISIGLLESAQLVGHAVSGFVILFGIDIEGVLEKLIGGLVLSAWVSMFPQQLILALNRLLIVSKINNATHPKKKGRSFKHEHLVFNCMLAACWIWGVVYFILLFSSDTVDFDPVTVSWGYRDKYGHAFNAIDMSLTALLLLASVVIYTVIVVRIFSYKRKRSVSFSKNVIILSITGGVLDKSISKTTEIRLLIQAFLAFAVMAIVMVLVFCMGWLINYTRTAGFVINSLWTVCCSIGPILNILMLRRVRKRVALLLCCSMEKVTHTKDLPFMIIKWRTLRRAEENYSNA